MLIDSHAHLNFNAYKSDLDEVILRSLDNDIWTVNIGSQYSTSKRAVEIAKKYEKGILATVGLHPIHLSGGIFKTKIDKEEIEFEAKEENFDYEKYKELAKDEKVVAVGEIGLDYWYRPKTKKKLKEFKDRQKQAFSQQLSLAKDLNLPVIFHCRTAHEDMINVLKDDGREFKGVIHCFSGKWQEAEKYLKMGFYLGFNGIIFKKIEGIDFQENIRKTPLDKILIETDCPYLTPPQAEGRNEPVYLKYIAEEIAKIKKLSYQEISDITTENAKKFFNL